MENSEDHTKRVVPRFGPLLKWTAGFAGAGVAYGILANLAMGWDTGYLFIDIVWFACIGAFVGLIIGFIKDLRS
jgi:uncharacterized membrane protein YeaQ/YmgE (transglycosylase-associated protein family)